MEVLRRCPLAIAQWLVHCAIALSTAMLDRVTKTMSVAPLLTNNLDNSKQKTSNLLSPAPPPYSWSLLGIVEGPAPPPSSKISRSFDLAWNPLLQEPKPSQYIYQHSHVTPRISERVKSALPNETKPWFTDQTHSLVSLHHWRLRHIVSAAQWRPAAAAQSRTVPLLNSFEHTHATMRQVHTCDTVPYIQLYCQPSP